MTTADPHKLVARIVADAADEQLNDAAFRTRTQRAARQLQRALEQLPASAANPSRRQAGGGRRPSYRFIAVPNGAGGTTSISLSTATFAELAQALGGDKQVSALARKVAVGHKPDSGVSRSAYVAKRLQQRAARAVK